MKSSLFGQHAARFGKASAAHSSLGRHTSRFGSMLVLFASALIAAPMDAGTITGRVVNKATGQYLRNAIVEVVGTDKSAATGDGGAFTIRDVPAGSVTVAVTYTGLDRAELTVVVPEEGSVSQDVELTSTIYDEDTVVLGEFVVAAQREGNAAAIVQQRVAVNVQTTIAADAFGDIAEGNVGEFLKFLPGVNVDYVDNDVRAVRLRGLAPKYASVTMDGHPIATSASSSIDTGRQFEFEQVSLATVDIIQINKTPTADMIASGMSGNVNVRNKSAFNQRGRQIKYNFNMNLNEYAADLGESPGWDDDMHHKGLLGGSIEFSDTFLEDKLGVVAAFNHSGSYVEQKVLIAGYTFDRNPANNAGEVPVLNNWNFQDGLKPTWRDAAVLNLDFRASDRLSFAWRSSYNWYKAPFYNRNWVITANTTGLAFTPDGWRIPTSTANLTNITNDTARSTSAAATNSASNAQVQGSNLRKSGATMILSPSFRWESDRITVDGSVSYSKSRNDYNSGKLGFFSQIVARMNGVSWDYTLDDEARVLISQISTPTSNNTNMLDLANYNQAVVANNEQRHSKDQFWTGNVDVTLRNDQWSKPTTFKFGADYRVNVRDIQNFNPSWRINTTTTLGPALNMGAFQEPYRPDIQKGEIVTGLPTGNAGLPPSPDKWRLYNLFTGYNTDPFVTTGFTANPSSTTITSVSQPFYNGLANVGANLRNFLQTQFDIEEKVNSLYGMATVDLSPDVQLLAGVRWESTDTVGRSFRDIGDAAAIAIAPIAAGYSATTWRNAPNYVLARYGTKEDREKSYDNILPSAQVRWEPRDSLVVRAAYFSSLLRPDFSTVVGGLTVNDTNTAFTVRNFDLEPETADNFDVRVEYYFEPVGVVSLGAFYKDISDLQITTTNTIDPNDIPDVITEAGLVPAANATINQRINAGNASIWGIELDYSQQLSFLPDPFSGLGVFFNGTYLHPNDIRIFSLTAEDGIPTLTHNIGLSFKKGAFDGRIGINTVGERTRGISGVTVSSDGTITPNTGANSTNLFEKINHRSQIDLNLSWRFNQRATLFCNVSNIFNEAQRRFLATPDHYNRYGEYGARVTLGVKGSF